jgi:type IV pilus secretin PilQ/predicted competence protein
MKKWTRSLMAVILGAHSAYAAGESVVPTTSPAVSVSTAAAAQSTPTVETSSMSVAAIPTSIPTESISTSADPVPAVPIETAVSGTTDSATGLSLNFQNADIDVVLQFFGQITKKIFLKSDMVRGFITLSSPTKVSPEDALEILQSVLDMKGFTLVPGPANVMKVLTHAEAAQSSPEVSFGSEEITGTGDRMITQVIPLRFIAATDLKNQIAPLITKAGMVVADERTNAVVVTEMSSNIRRLLKMIQALDTRTPQVLIEALIVEVTLTDEMKLGIEWSYNGNFNAEGDRFRAEGGQAFSLAGTISEGLRYTIFRSDQNLRMILQALATNKNVNVLSTPHIMTLNNQPATIKVGEEVPVLTQTRNIQGGETIRSFDYKAVAVELEVTPRINPDREVQMKVHPMVKKILGFNAELNAPILATREAQTSVLVKDGQTVVIGGLMKDDRSVNESKIPILGDIPLLGYAFKRKGSVREKTELLVFLTPRVITGAEEAQKMTIEKERQAKSSPTPHRLDARQHYRMGKFFYKEKRYEEAKDHLNQALAKSPDTRLNKKIGRLLSQIQKRH